jgi:hypothetical protein
MPTPDADRQKTGPMLTRRRLLASLAAVGGGALAGLAWLGGSRRRARARREAEVLALADALPEAAGAIGAHYLAGLAEPPERAALARRVAADLEAADPAGPDADRALEAGPPAGGDTAGRAAAAVRADFAAGRTVEVAGWVLARTEASLYALKALAAAG